MQIENNKIMELSTHSYVFNEEALVLLKEDLQDIQIKLIDILPQTAIEILQRNSDRISTLVLEMNIFSTKQSEKIIEEQNSLFKENSLRNETDQQLRNDKNLLNLTLKPELLRLQEEYETLSKQMISYETELNNLNKKLQEKEKEKDIALGVGIPIAFFTFGISAAISGGAIAGIVIIIDNIKKEIETRKNMIQTKKEIFNDLQNELSKNKSLVSHKNQEIDDKQKIIDNSNNKINVLNELINKRGKNVTEISKTRMSMDSLIINIENLKLKCQNIEGQINRIPHKIQVLLGSQIRNILPNIPPSISLSTNLYDTQVLEKRLKELISEKTTISFFKLGENLPLINDCNIF